MPESPESNSLPKGETRRQALGKIASAATLPFFSGSTGVVTPLRSEAEMKRVGGIVWEMVKVLMNADGAPSIERAEVEYELLSGFDGKMIFPKEADQIMRGRISLAKRSPFQEPAPEAEISNKSPLENRSNISTASDETRLVLSHIMGGLEHVREKLFTQLGHIANANIQE